MTPRTGSRRPRSPGGSESVSRDALFDGAVAIWQPRAGYRVTIDTLLLAAFAAAGLRRGPVSSVVDLGAGVGGVALSLHHLLGVSEATLVEREPALAELARKNAREAGLAAAVLEADVAEALPRALEAGARCVLCNPPFFEPTSTRPRRDPLASAARAGSVAPFLRAAAFSLGRRGRAYFIYPARALTALLLEAKRHQLVAKRLRLVHPFVSEPARVALVDFARGRPGGLVVEPPLCEWSARGVRSAELVSLLGAPAADRK